MKQLLKYYQTETDIKFSDYLDLKVVQKNGFYNFLKISTIGKKSFVQIIAYCLMPTHVHLVLKQLKNDGISKYFGNILNSYTRYFNTQHKRKGPLWEAKFKNILVNSDEQLLHLTRYIHLNPATASLVDKPELWLHSSYQEYIKSEKEPKICDFNNLIEIKFSMYRKFVNDRISYQRELAKIKALKLE